MSLNAPMDKTPDEQANSAIKSGWDSANVVNEIINSADAATHTEQKDNRVWANYKHLEIVLARENVISYVANNSVDLSQWTTTISAGKAYVTGSEWIKSENI